MDLKETRRGWVLVGFMDADQMSRLKMTFDKVERFHRTEPHLRGHDFPLEEWWDFVTLRFVSWLEGREKSTGVVSLSLGHGTDNDVLLRIAAFTRRTGIVVF